MRTLSRNQVLAKDDNVCFCTCYIGFVRAKLTSLQDPDLQWVEDNIPSSVTNDNTFPSYAMDSDEVQLYQSMCCRAKCSLVSQEIMNTRFEISKMQ